MKGKMTGRMKQGTAFWLAAFMAMQMMACMPVAAAEELPEEIIFAEPVVEDAPETVVELPEEIISIEPAASLDKVYLLYGRATNSGGLSWDGNGNLSLTNYSTTNAIYIRTNEANMVRNTVVTVNGDCTIGMLVVSAWEDSTQHHLTIRGSGTLRVRQTARISEGNAMVENQDGSITVENVTVDMISTRSGSHGHGFYVGGNDSISVKNAKISIQLSTIDSFGIWTGYGSGNATIENSDYIVHGTNADADSYIIRTDGDLLMKNVNMKATGRILDGIYAKNLTADHLTLEADLSEIKAHGAKLLSCRTQMSITDSAITATGIGRLINAQDLSLKSTTINATLNNYTDISGLYEAGARGIECAGTADKLVQGCNIILKLENYNGGSEDNTSYAISSSPITFADTVLRINVNMGKEDTAITAIGGGVLFKGNTDVEITSTGYALRAGNASQVRLQDSLAIVTPHPWKIAEFKTTLPNGNYMTANAIADSNGQPAKVLKITKAAGGEGTGSGEENTGSNSGSTGGNSGNTGGTGTGASTGPGSGSTQEPVVKGEWKKTGGKWWYRRADGSWPANRWEKIGGTWYHFDKNGYMQTGWLKEGGTWYYLKGSGAMATGWVKDGNTWYYMSGSGAMLTGWQKVGGTWYYLKPSGAMATGWIKLGSTWYYLKPSGAMATGWIKLGNTWYYLKPSGAMATGWIKPGNTWYYLDSSGAMLANSSRIINGKTYYFNASGACTNP